MHGEVKDGKLGTLKLSKIPMTVWFPVSASTMTWLHKRIALHLGGGNASGPGVSFFLAIRSPPWRANEFLDSKAVAPASFLITEGCDSLNTIRKAGHAIIQVPAVFIAPA